MVDLNLSAAAHIWMDDTAVDYCLLLKNRTVDFLKHSLNRIHRVHLEVVFLPSD